MVISTVGIIQLINNMIHLFQTYRNGMPIEKIMMVKKIGKYLKVYMANGVAPEYKQKSYGKYKLSKLFMKYIYK